MLKDILDHANLNSAKKGANTMKTMYLILKILIVSLLIISTFITGMVIYEKKNFAQIEIAKDGNEELVSNSNQIPKEKTLGVENISRDLKVVLPGENVQVITEIDDWRLVLVNAENPLPEDFKIELANYDRSRQFDARAIDELIIMIKDMKASGASNIWIQSAYRTPEYQERLFKNKVQEFINMGKSQEEAEIYASRWVNKSETSEHNLGLAVDFNNVKQDFENTKEFEWLTQNAENYGFVLRYKKDKKELTGVSYEPWHWRYVGVEHAKKMNKLDMCLEEYVEYLKVDKR